jgi:hypothetical protein
MIYNILSSNEITELVNNPIVKSEKQNLSDTQKEVKFSISLPDALRVKLENSLSIDLSQTETIPMRWIKGDTPPHIDRGETHFNNTYLIYLTDSIGDLIIDGKTYSITAGEAHVFSEGLEHYTINTGGSERLMIGPMSESGFGVGGLPASILYYGNETDAINGENAIGDYYIDNYTLQTVNDISTWIILNNVDGTDPTPNGGPHYTNEDLVPTGTYYVYYNGPPVSIIYFDNETDAINEVNPIAHYYGNYTLQTVNDISAWMILKNVNGVDITQTAGPHYTNQDLLPDGVYYVYPYIPPAPRRRIYMGSLFTNNAQVFYKPGSLSTGGGGSGVKNSRHKQRRT